LRHLDFFGDDIEQTTMQRAILLVLICGSSLCLAACKRETALPPSPNPSTAAQDVEPAASLPGAPAAEPEPDWSVQLAKLGPPSLMSWREVANLCEWAVYQPPEFQERVFLRSPQCPETLVWHKAGGKTLFALDGRIYLHDWQAAKVSALGAPPVAGAYFELGFSNDGVVRSCDVQTRPVPGQESQGDQSEPEQGATADYTIVWERGVNGTWRKAHEWPINYELMPADTCSGGVDLQRTGLMYYNPQAQLANNCVEQRQPGELCPSDQAIERFKSQIPVSDDGYEYLAFSASSFVAYPITFGDSVHVKAPVFVIQDDAVTKIYDRRGGPAEQWDILLGGDYFLVRDEVGLTSASLFKWGSAVPLIEFPAEMRVVWIPGSVAAAPVIEMAR
jgi:hypothetical protein